MKLVVIVLNKLDCLDKLLTAFGKNSIPGATILSSRGMAHTLEAHDELRFIGSLRMLMSANYKENRTILMAVPDEKVDTVVELVNKATGGLDQPDSGILFTLPIDRVEGMTHK